jgi:hypothetical protein
MMKPMVRNVNRWNKRDQQGPWNYCSILFCFMWSFVVGWILFLGYCWYFGMINDQKINNLVHNMDVVINKTEQSLLRGGQSLTHALHPQHVAMIEDKKRQKTGSLIQEENVVQSIPHSEDDVYIIFSTDCSPYQDWQTLVMFYSAKRVKQKGSVIRIASGCSEEKQKLLTDLYDRLYHGYYYAHFTPDFKKDEKTNKKCNSSASHF